MSRYLGTVSKSLLMCIVIRSVLKEGFSALRPSRTVCVICMRRVLVEYFDLKPCWTKESGIVVLCCAESTSLLFCRES